MRRAMAASAATAALRRVRRSIQRSWTIPPARRRAPRRSPRAAARVIAPGRQPMREDAEHHRGEQGERAALLGEIGKVPKQGLCRHHLWRDRGSRRFRCARSPAARGSSTRMHRSTPCRTRRAGPRRARPRPARRRRPRTPSATNSTPRRSWTRSRRATALDVLAAPLERPRAGAAAARAAPADLRSPRPTASRCSSIARPRSLRDRRARRPRRPAQPTAIWRSSSPPALRRPAGDRRARRPRRPARRRLARRYRGQAPRSRSFYRAGGVERGGDTQDRVRNPGIRRADHGELGDVARASTAARECRCFATRAPEAAAPGTRRAAATATGARASGGKQPARAARRRCQTA